MGYTTDFEGSVTVTPPLNAHEIAYLREFADTRHCVRKSGPWTTSRSDSTPADSDVSDPNEYQPGQPGYWCNWEPVDDGSALTWNGVEKFYDSPEWMSYLIDTFLKPGALLADEMTHPVADRHYPQEFAHFTFDHVVDGTIDAQGEDADDRWRLVVAANAVTTKKAHLTWDDES